MEMTESYPIVIFDNQCYLCTKFVKVINFFANNKIMIIGHYSKFGEKIRDEILDESALDMFWLIDKKTAYGGRAAILPLIKLILCKRNSKVSNLKINDECKQECKTIKALMERTFSLFSNSKIIKIHE
jgi:hypothetical protein